jgi:hypothetical protein
MLVEKISLGEGEGGREEEDTLRAVSKEDLGFKKYLRKIYMKEVMEKKGMSSSLKDKANNRCSMGRLSSDKAKCLNIKSVVFGSLDLNLQPDVPSSLEMPVRPIHNNEYEALTGSKMANIFLPNIARQTGHPVLRKEKSKLEKMTRVGTEASEGTDRAGSRCRALWLSEGLSRIGCSFRINTLQVRRQA